MLLLVNTRPHSLCVSDHNNLGYLVTPFSHTKLSHVVNKNYAIDNGAFSGLDENKFMNIVNNFKNNKKELFIAVPDVVGNHKETIKMFYKWRDKLQDYNLGFVAQDGMTENDIPKDAQAIFIGGTTEYKLGQTAYKVIQKAKENNLWVHMGRVNSLKRIKYAYESNVDSVDGTKYAMFDKVYLQQALEYIESLKNQTTLKL